MKLVVVTGARCADDDGFVVSTVRAAAPDRVMHGAAGRGVDLFVARWLGAERPDAELAFPAQWGRDGARAAGHVRNGGMVKAAALFARFGWVVEVVAFPSPAGSGTQGCVAAARAERLPTVSWWLDRAGRPTGEVERWSPPPTLF